MISSLLHLVDLRPRVYYTLTNFRGGGARPPCPPPQYANDTTYSFLIIYCKSRYRTLSVIYLHDNNTNSVKDSHKLNAKHISDLT